jgi:hypothetical protein
MSYRDLIREHCEGQEWHTLAPMVQMEICAQILRGDGFDACVAASSESQFAAVFTHKLADLIESRFDEPAWFAASGRAFAASACALLMHELETQAEQEWETALDEWHDEHPEINYDVNAENQARHRDFMAVPR